MEYYEYLVRHKIDVQRPVAITEQVWAFLRDASRDDALVRRFYKQKHGSVGNGDSRETPLSYFMKNQVGFGYFQGLYNADPEYFVKSLQIEEPIQPIRFACSISFRSTHQIELVLFLAEKDPFFLSQGGGLAKLANDFSRQPAQYSLESLQALFQIYTTRFANAMVPMSRDNLGTFPRLHHDALFFFINDLIGTCTIVESMTIKVVQKTVSSLELTVSLHWSPHHWVSTTCETFVKVERIVYEDRYQFDAPDNTLSFSIPDRDHNEPLLVKALKLSRLPLSKIREIEYYDHARGPFAFHPFKESILWSLNHSEINLQKLRIVSDKVFFWEILDSLKHNTKLRELEIDTEGRDGRWWYAVLKEMFSLDILNKILDLMIRNTTIQLIWPWGQIPNNVDMHTKEVQTKMMQIWYLLKVNRIDCRKKLGTRNRNDFVGILEAAITMCDRDYPQDPGHTKLNLLYSLLQENPVVWAAGARLSSAGEGSNPSRKRMRAKWVNGVVRGDQDKVCQYNVMKESVDTLGGATQQSAPDKVEDYVALLLLKIRHWRGDWSVVSTGRLKNTFGIKTAEDVRKLPEPYKDALMCILCINDFFDCEWEQKRFRRMKACQEICHELPTSGKDFYNEGFELESKDFLVEVALDILPESEQNKLFLPRMKAAAGSAPVADVDGIPPSFVGNTASLAPAGADPDSAQF